MPLEEEEGSIVPVGRTKEGRFTLVREISSPPALFCIYFCHNSLKKYWKWACVGLVGRGSHENREITPGLALAKPAFLDGVNSWCIPSLERVALL
jgi:hypothetical protein